MAVQLASTSDYAGAQSGQSGAGVSDLESTSFEALGAPDVEVLPATLPYDPRDPGAERAKIAEIMLPADAHQGGEGAQGEWYAVDIHLQLDVVKGASEGSVASVYLNNQAFALLTVEPTADGVEVGGATVYGAVSKTIQGRSPETVELSFRNIVQTVSVQPGRAAITADIRNFGAPLITSMRVLNDSRFVKTIDGPLNLAARAESVERTDDDSTELLISLESDAAAEWRDMSWQVLLAGPVDSKSSVVEVGSETIDAQPHREQIEIPVRAGGNYDATLVVSGSNRTTRQLDLGPVEVGDRGTPESPDNSQGGYLVLAVAAIAIAAVGLRLSWRSSGR